MAERQEMIIFYWHHESTEAPKTLNALFLRAHNWLECPDFQFEQEQGLSIHFPRNIK